VTDEIRCPFFGLPVEVERRRVPGAGGAWIERIECLSAGPYCPVGKCSLRGAVEAAAAEAANRGAARPAPGRFEVRIEGIGGLGANLAGRLVADAAVEALDCHASNFASYGSEKKGSPVRSFVRLADAPIRENAPVLYPDLLVVFHEALLAAPATLQGLRPDATVVVHSARPPREIGRAHGLPEVRLGAVDAARIARDEKTRTNVVMLGALEAAIDFLPAGALEAALRAKFGRLPAEALEANARAFRRGRAEVVWDDIDGSLARIEPPKIHKTAWGWRNAPIGGVAPEAGGTVLRDARAMREGVVPVFVAEKCTNCALCEIACPDYCFVWRAGGDPKGPTLAGIEYRYCKGCMRCVEVCPVGALVEAAEAEVDLDRLRVPLEVAS
jgi:pyruvate ferredoxin oxidoreductase gamma subunit